MTVPEKKIKDLEARLDDFDQEVRNDALMALNDMADSGSLITEPDHDTCNLHCHSFFSYNGYGYSPTHLAWLGKKKGLKTIGIVDFDVLDGVDEFLNSCDYLNIRACAGMETRVFIPEFADIEINSPGEPGVCYHMGTGFISSAVPFSGQRNLDDICSRATQRNSLILKRINDFLDPLTIDLREDIFPSTPSGNVTERHIILRITNKANERFENPSQYWSEKLGLPVEIIQKEMAETEVFQNLLRKKLIKRGGAGYIQPTGETFPMIDDFYQLIFACQAIPCAAWLDGTSPGEQAIEKFLDFLIHKGTAAINIIPDRNWNLQDPEEKLTKLGNLNHVIKVASDFDLPVLIGTEMNSYGQKLVDDLNVPELAPHRKQFLKGADFIYGHTQMQKRFGMGYQSSWASTSFKDRKTKNEFFTSVGRLIPPSGIVSSEYERISVNSTADEVLNFLKLNKE
jgi:hypothetical protein